MKHLRKSQRREVTRFVEYLISGGAYFWSGYIAFFVGDKIFHLNLWWAKLAANMFGWTVNYLLQRYWVFRNPKLAKHQTEVTTRYIIITLVDFVLDYIIVASLKSVGISPYIGQFISSGFFTGWNYIWYRFWVFPEKFVKKRRHTKLTVARVAAHRPHGHSAYHRLSSPARPANRRSRPHRRASLAAAVSKSPVLTQRITYTPRSALQFFLAPAQSEERRHAKKADR